MSYVEGSCKYPLATDISNYGFSAPCPRSYLTQNHCADNHVSRAKAGWNGQFLTIDCSESVVWTHFGVGIGRNPPNIKNVASLIHQAPATDSSNVH